MGMDKEERVCLVLREEEKAVRNHRGETSTGEKTDREEEEADNEEALTIAREATVGTIVRATTVGGSARRRQRLLRRSTRAASTRVASGGGVGGGGGGVGGGNNRRVLVKKVSLVAIGPSKRHTSKKITDHFNGINKLAQKRALMRSKQIDQALLTDQEAKRKEVHLLLIGGNGCGKSTLVKQFRIHYGDAFPDEQRKALVGQVLENLADAVHIVLENMRTRDMWFHDPYIKDMMEEFQAYCPKFNAQIFRYCGKQVDIENSIHYAHVDFVDEDTLTSVPTETDLPSSCCHDNELFDVGYRESANRRRGLDLRGLDGLEPGGGDGGGVDTASASLIIYYNTQGLEESHSEADERDRADAHHNAARATYISNLGFGRWFFSRNRQQQQQDSAAAAIDEGSSDSSCARLVEHLHLGEAHDTDSSGGGRRSSSAATLDGVLPPRDEIVYCFLRHIKTA